jgi:hypothetical protein
VQSQQLPTESQVFEDEVRPTTERTDQPAEEMPERHDHGKNFSGKDRIKLCAKSLISQVYDLLARHTNSDGDRDVSDISALPGFAIHSFDRKLGIQTTCYRERIISAQTNCKAVYKCTDALLGGV